MFGLIEKRKRQECLSVQELNFSTALSLIHYKKYCVAFSFFLSALNSGGGTPILDLIGSATHQGALLWQKLCDRLSFSDKNYGTGYHD